MQDTYGDILKKTPPNIAPTTIGLTSSGVSSEEPRLAMHRRNSSRNISP